MKKSKPTNKDKQKAVSRPKQVGRKPKAKKVTTPNLVFLKG